ncbi:sialate O-acetylesterase [Sunxiuqinia indica]|uniref:sialate O-acetylesterase n=1 Tax=Sunxiuqinia indica TaxID=2692584 RepID=UPI00135C1E99|nr:sialate O-acetylesterase [Sunxiuqinia indica]
MNKITCKLVLLFFACVAIFSSVQAKVKMSALFADHMVLQQQSEVAIWGWADARSEVNVTTSWNDKSYTAKAAKDGKFKLMVETPAAGGPYEIIVSDGEALTIENVLIGEVWLCSGQSNMEMPMKGFRGQPVLGSNMDILKSNNENIRVITVPRSSQTVAQENFEAKWKVADAAAIRNFSATGYYFGRLLNEMLDVPIGLIEVSYGGSCVQAWMSPETSVAFEGKQVPAPGDTIPVPNRTPTVLFNGMLNPVIGYGMKGCIWYQGETNYQEPDRYEELFPTMVNEWRELWGIGNFPFYYAQIAPFDYSVFYSSEDVKEKYNSAYLRDAQRKALDDIPNSGMAVLMDVGEETCIHPMHKQEGGERLALWALGETYDLPDFSYKSPAYDAFEVKGSQVVVSFKDVANGLTTFGKELTGFEIAGENKVFYPADVFLRTKSVVVSSPRVEKPVAVRYAFKDFIVGTLFGTDGLPVSSFRTDDW